MNKALRRFILAALVIMLITAAAACLLTTILLKRGFTLGEWNSLVLPVNMTTAQVKQTFGDNTKLAKLKGLKDEGDVIEFEQVPLPSDGAAIEKNILIGQFILSASRARNCKLVSNVGVLEVVSKYSNALSQYAKSA